MKRLLPVLAVMLTAACSGNRPPNGTPTPPPPEPQCAEGQTHSCWHHPPDSRTWLYACPVKDAGGGVVGVINVVGGPAQCPGSTPVPPEPTPPPSGDVPPKGQPQGGEKLLRIDQDGLRLVSGVRFDPFMAIPCCEGWAKVPNQLWPCASEGFMDETHKYGANWFHCRVGPWFGDADHESEWAAIGGAYDFNAPDGWNAKFWEKQRALVWHAYKQGSYVELAPIDTWYVKHCQWGDQQCPWPASDVAGAYNGQLTPGQEKLIRKTVEELGCFGNVTFVTGNEEDEVPAGGSLYQRYVEIIRDEEQKSGCGFVHIIGTGSSKEGIGADYSITHSTNPVTGSCNGRYCVNNEHNPETSPEQEAANYDTARKSKQGTWGAWRAGAKDDKWEKRLQLFKEVRGGAATGCFAPDPNDSQWDANPIPPSSRSPMMMAAVNEAKAKVGDRCGATAPCTTEPCAPPVHLGCLETNGLVAEQLRLAGHCASGPWVDATAVLAPDGLWEEYHICSTGNGCYTNQNGYKFAWKYNGAAPKPPDPTPPSGQCKNPDPAPVSNCTIKEHTKGPNWTVIDSTFRVHDAAYCASIGFTDGRVDCPVRMEGDPLRTVCESEVVGTPVYTTTIPGAEPDPSGNPYLFRVPRGQTGLVTVHASKNPGVSCSVQVTQ